jgi:hypothetical protein
MPQIVRPDGAQSLLGQALAQALEAYSTANNNVVLSDAQIRTALATLFQNAL